MKLVGRGNAEFAEVVLSGLPADIEVGLAFFSTKTVPMVLPTKDHAKLLLPLEALRKGDYADEGVTALRSAVLEAVKMFGTPLLGDSVYLISDGGENHSRAQEVDVEGVLSSSGIRLIALTLQSGGLEIRSRTPEELDGSATLGALVRASGGTILSTPDTVGVTPATSDLLGSKGIETQLGQDINRQIDQLLTFYRLDFTLPDPVDKPRKWTLKLEGFDKATAGKLELIYPTVLAPCH